MRVVALWALVVVCLACAAWLARRPRELSLRRLLSSPFVLLTLLGLLLPVTVGLIRRLDFLVRSLTSAGTGGGAVLAIAAGMVWVGGAVWWIAGPARRWSDRRFLLVAGVTFLLVRLLWAGVVSMPPGDDFGKMWGLAGDLAESFDVPREPVSPDDSSAIVRRAYFERVLVYFLPLRALFGESFAVYKVANGVVLVLSSLLVFALARHWFGGMAARTAFIVSQMSVETWLAQLIPTHDIPGALLTLVCVALCAALWASAGGGWKRSLVLALALGLALELLDLQRTNAMLLLLVWWLVAATGWIILLCRRRAPGAGGGARGRFGVWRLALLLLVPTLTYGVLEGTLLRAGLLRPPEIQKERKMKKITAYTDSWGTGSSNHWKAEWVRRDLEAGDWSRFNRRKFLTDLTLHPLHRISHAVRKADRLYSLGEQTHFYVRGAKIAGRVRIDRSREFRIKQVNAVVVAVFVTLLVAGVVAAWCQYGVLRIELFPAVLLAVLSAVLVLLFETQPRYIYQIWTLGALYIGFLFRNAAGEGRPVADRGEENDDG